MRDITVTNSTLGSDTCTSCFMVAPIVTGVAPGTVAQGATSRDITITGVGFSDGAVTSVSGPGVVVNYTQFDSPTQLTANVDVALGASLGVRDVTVTDPGNGVGTCTGCLTVTPGPTVTSTSPVSRGGGAVNQVVTINGTNFLTGAVASFSGAGITVTNTLYVSPTVVKATINIAGGSAIGTRAVSVTNTDGGVGQCAACFTVNKTPNVTDWQITSGNYTVKLRHHGGSITLTARQVMHADIVIIGSNFVPGATAAYSSDDVDVDSTTYVSSTKIKQTIDVDVLDFYLNALPVDRAVTVTNPDGGSFTCQGAVVLLV
jgi:hypothetical protein